MDRAMTLRQREIRRIFAARRRLAEPGGTVLLVRENAYLAEENERLHREIASLAASAEIWIRLYEAALARANGQSPVQLLLEPFPKRE